MAATATDLIHLPREALEPMKKSQAQCLVEFVPDEALFRSTDGETTYATIPVATHHETWPLRAKGFRRWLIGRFYQTEEKPPGAQALSDALSALEARAQFGGRVHDVHVRVAAFGPTIYLDLVSPTWEVVEITSSGWRVCSDPPVKFRRTKGHAAGTSARRRRSPRRAASVRQRPRRCTVGAFGRLGYRSPPTLRPVSRAQLEQ